MSGQVPDKQRLSQVVAVEWLKVPVQFALCLFKTLTSWYGAKSSGRCLRCRRWCSRRRVLPFKSLSVRTKSENCAIQILVCPHKILMVQTQGKLSPEQCQRQSKLLMRHGDMIGSLDGAEHSHSLSCRAGWFYLDPLHNQAPSITPDTFFGKRHQKRVWEFHR